MGRLVPIVVSYTVPYEGWEGGVTVADVPSARVVADNGPTRGEGEEEVWDMASTQ
jgi:hypothetical protein